MRSLLMLLCVAGTLLISQASATPAQVKLPPGKGIDPAIVAAYEKLGGVYGVWVPPVLSFKSNVSNPAYTLPGFSFQKEPEADLPDAGVPFGLSSTTMTDAGMAKL